MPRYFFDVTDGAFVPDELGAELSDLAEARTEAVALAGSLLRDNPARFWDGDEWKIDVRAECATLLFTLFFIARDAPAASREATG